MTILGRFCNSAAGRDSSFATLPCVTDPAMRLLALFAIACSMSSAVSAADKRAGDPAAGVPSVARAKYLWSQSPHGRMLERILPPSIEPRQLPQPRSEG